ncbi:MAG: ABC transporter ATP-binding protein [Chloroflexi bacterium]|nr:ABC transporter ATP-binding protein [Chloroflexota bacterium]
MSAEFVARGSFTSNRRNPLRFVLSHVMRHPVFAITMVVGALSNAVFATAVPYFIGQAFRAVNEGQWIDVVANAALAVIASQLIRAALQVMRNFSSEIFAQRIERDVRDELYASLLGKSMTFHDMLPVGEIMARVTNDVREMNLMMNPGMNLLIGSGFFLIVPLVSAPLIYPSLIFVPLAFTVIYALVQTRYMRKLRPQAEEVRVSFGKMNAYASEALEGLQVVKGAAQEDRIEAHFKGIVDRVRQALIRQGIIESKYIPQLLLGLVVFGGFVHAAVLYNAGLIDIGSVVTYVGQIALFGFPVFTSQFSFSQISNGYASAERILAIINTETDLDQNEQGFAADIRGEISLEHVDFAYHSGDNLILQDVHFTVPAGKTVAIVGQTGVGKTTITKLINRTYDVTSGRVLVDGVDVRDWNLARLRSQISIIEQDIFLFSRSIADNIRFGKPDATLDEVIAAARKAQADEFISTLPEGYDTVVGQRGVTLSGGQRQRIAIARAFVTNPPILILDDSTSAIDSATEDRIQQAIWAASRGRTTILITHRLSQIRWADHIVVLRGGQVVAQGAHDHLLATSDAYRRIFARYEAAPATVKNQG